MRRHPRRTQTDPSRPEAWSTCDRSGFVGQHNDMQWQWEWQGTTLINKRILVVPDMLDQPNRQLGTIVLPPDPTPIMNARIEPYFIDEQTFRLQQNGVQRLLMDGTPRLESNLQSGNSSRV